VLLGTNQGIFTLNIQKKSVVPSFPGLDKFGWLSVMDILPFKDQLFIATAGNGLFNIKGNVIYNSTEDLFQKNALLFNALTDLYVDNNQKIWIGSERGISSFDPLRSGFLSIGPSGNLKKGLPSPNVWSFSEDPSGNFIFVGTDVGVSRYDRGTAIFNQFLRSDNSNEDGENGKEVVLSIYSLNKDKALVGCLDGLYELTVSGNAYRYSKLTYVDKENQRKHERIYAIVPYRNQEYFLATKGGVILYNLKTKKSRLFEHNPELPAETIGIGICRVVYKDPDGNFWFTTSGGGLNLLTEENGELKIKPHPINSKFISKIKDYISTIVSFKKDELWLGTFGSGLVHLKLKTGEISIYNNKNGLPNNVIYGLLQDEKNKLWLSTNRGLALFNPETKQVTIYKEINGLVSNEFNSNAYFKARNGELFFGGINGFNHFMPANLLKPTENINVILSKLKLGEKWVIPGGDSPLKTVLSNTEILELDYNQRSFTIKFHTNDLNNPQLINYKYILEGSDEGEKFIGADNELAFNALSPGDYVLKVYARIGDGPWSEPTQLKIVIKSPYWLTWWFWTLMALLLALITFVIFRRRIELARREQVKLEIKISERTKEIRLQKSQIEDQNKLIEDEKNKVVEQQRLLQIEKDKTEQWLNNTLPSEAVITLKRKGKVPAQAFDTVSVLFTDVVGFSRISETMTPSRLVTKLDVLFRKFDEIIEANKLEKIKTIGDAYMCAGGVPSENSTNPIDACCAALQIQAYMSKLKYDAIANHEDYWEIRLGINTGPLTAGIIGNLRLAYDIWGPTVNLAQRMEMLGEPGKVTITGATFNHIEPYFECEYKGKVQSKARKWVDMYVVKRIKPELSLNGEGLQPNTRFDEIKKLHHYSNIKYYKTEHHVMKILEKGLSPNYYYHSINHTKDVVNAVERIALLEGVTDESLFLLKTAAILHDAGFIERYDNNEEIGAIMAAEILPKYGYTEQHIKTIVELIHVTEIPHKPLNKILCDADLDYLGRDDFDEIADKLRRELREMGKIQSDRQWDEIQVKFLNQHQYFTQTAKELRQEKKEINIQKVMQRLEENKYLD
jgi:class 3 adenylate cyclase/predicted metal-dependent HD superfamily phosphohydrolase/sugar lactone lactonase YvrE